jgi:hypothetical protein
VLQERNQANERAVFDEEALVVGEEPAVGGVGTSEPGQHVPVPPPPPLIDDMSWASAPTAVAAPASAGPVKTKRHLSWGQVLMFLAGVAALVFGVGAVILGGLAGSVTAPVVQVFTYDHTPLLGLMETGVGVVLVVCVLIPGGRWIAGPVAVATIVGGALIVAQLDWIQTNLAAEKRFGWVVIGVGAVAYVGAMVPTPKRMVVEGSASPAPVGVTSA